MKHLFFKSAAALLALSAFTSCSEEAAMEEVMNHDDVIQSISITGSDFELESSARSMVQIGESGVNFLWAENDTVGIFPNKGSQAEFAMSEGSGTQTATFSGGGWALKSSATYAAYYPYNFYNRNLAYIPVSYEGQAQTGNNNTDHIGTYDFMAASVATPSNGAVSFDMQHLGCLVMLKANLGEDVTLTKVSVKADWAVFKTSGYMDLTAVTPQIKAKTSVNSFDIELKNFTVTTAETSTIYFMMAPANLLGKTLTITLYDEDGEYIMYETAGKNCIAGKAYAYSLTDGVKLMPEYAVDLGLPSGTLWADRNVGADSPEACGDYFAWGETEPKDLYLWSTYKLCKGTFDTQTKYCTYSSYGTLDGKTTLDFEDDAAYVNMGEKWRMPTPTELRELLNYCTWTWTTQNRVFGHKVTGLNGNSIFLPAAGYLRNRGNSWYGSRGYYWTSSLYESNPSIARGFYFGSDSFIWEDENRYNGWTVRAVVR